MKQMQYPIYQSFKSSVRIRHCQDAIEMSPAILLLAASGMSDNKQQEIIPALELKCPEEGIQSIVEFRSPPEVRTRFLKVFITQYHQPMNQERQKIQNTIYLTSMVLTMPVGNFVSTLCSMWYPQFLRPLLFSFSIFHRARAQTTSSMAFSLVTSLSVIRLFL
jgi:hypothetical protein